MVVADVMTLNPRFIHPDISVPEARSIMKKEKIGRLVVLDKSNKLVGIITERDIVNASPSVATTLDMYEMSHLLSRLKVEQVMKKNVITVDENEVVEEAARIMVDNNISALPVLKNGVLTGIVSDGDLYRLFIKMFGAYQEGVRITLLVPEERGELHKLASCITEKGGNIHALVICEGSDVTNKRCLIKVSDISKDALLEATKPYSIKVLDIR